MKLLKFNNWAANDASQHEKHFRETLKKRFEPKPYYLENRFIKIAADIGAVGLQVITAFLVFEAAKAVFVGFGISLQLAAILSAFLLVVAEVVKNKAFGGLAKAFLQFGKIDPGKAFLVLLFAALTAFLSLEGVEVAINKETALDAKLEAKEAALTKEIEMLNSQLLEATNKQKRKILTILEAKEAARVSLVTDAKTAKAEKVGQGGKYKGLAVAIDLLVFVLLFYVQYYYYRSFAELSEIETEAASSISPGGLDVKKIDNKNTSIGAAVVSLHQERHQERPKIGFEMSKGVKMVVCAECGKQFEPKNHKHRFCNTECRVKNWTDKTAVQPYRL